jgi:hypothetical protein
MCEQLSVVLLNVRLRQIMNSRKVAAAVADHIIENELLKFAVRKCVTPHKIDAVSGAAECIVKLGSVLFA